MSFRPLADRILVKRFTEDEYSEGGIFIPPTAQEKPQRGEIVSVGPGRILDDGRLVEPRVRKGEIILFGKYAGCDFKFFGEDHLILREDEILGVIEG